MDTHSEFVTRPYDPCSIRAHPWRKNYPPGRLCGALSELAMSRIWQNDKRIDALFLHSDFKVVVVVCWHTVFFGKDAAFGTVPRDKRRQFGPPRMPERRKDRDLRQVAQSDNDVPFLRLFSFLTRFRNSLKRRPS